MSSHWAWVSSYFASCTPSLIFTCVNGVSSESASSLSEPIWNVPAGSGMKQPTMSEHSSVPGVLVGVTGVVGGASVTIFELM